MTEESRSIHADGDALARAAGLELLRLAKASIEERNLFTLALAGGSTPKKLYSLLGSDPAFASFPWEKTHLFFGDERHVPPDDSESNYGMVEKTLLVSGLVPESHVHRVRAELPDARKAAADYDLQLHTFFTDSMRHDNFPRFDFILLGMGPDGHTASLFPGSRGLNEKARWVIANPVEKLGTDRITFTFPVLNTARAVYLLVAGADKADMLHEVIVQRRGRELYPVQKVQPQGSLVWMLDQAAALRLPPVLAV